MLCVFLLLLFFFFWKQTALTENRKELAELLTQLIQQQEERHLDMKALLHEMEAQRQEQAQDYWLMQYQRLMDTMPESGELVKQLGQSAPCLPTAVPPLVNGDSMLNDQASAAAASAPPISEVFTESSCVICLDSSVISAEIHLFLILRSLAYELCDNNFVCITAVINSMLISCFTNVILLVTKY